MGGSESVQGSGGVSGAARVLISHTPLLSPSPITAHEGMREGMRLVAKVLAAAVALLLTVGMMRQASFASGTIEVRSVCRMQLGQRCMSYDLGVGVSIKSRSGALAPSPGRGLHRSKSKHVSSRQCLPGACGLASGRLGGSATLVSR